MSPGSTFSMLSLMLRNAQANLYDIISFNTNRYLSTGILFTENDVTEPDIFLRRMESAIGGERNMQSTLAMVSERALDILFHTELIELPLYINDPMVRVIAVWRLRKGI